MVNNEDIHSRSEYHAVEKSRHDLSHETGPMTTAGSTDHEHEYMKSTSDLMNSQNAGSHVYQSSHHQPQYSAVPGQVVVEGWQSGPMQTTSYKSSTQYQETLPVQHYHSSMHQIHGADRQGQVHYQPEHASHGFHPSHYQADIQVDGAVQLAQLQYQPEHVTRRTAITEHDDSPRVGGASHAYTSSLQRVSGGATFNQENYATEHQQVGYANTEAEYYSSGEYIPRAGERIVSTRVVSRTTGAERIISTTERVDESRSTILSERVVEHEIKAPKKVIREETYEKVIIVPEKMVLEEIVEGTRIQKERVIERSKPTIIETVVEVPEIETIERTIEFVQPKVVPRTRHVDVIEKRERRKEIDKIIEIKKIVEVPQIHYRDVHVEKRVEVQEIVEEIVRREVAVPNYVDVPVPEYVEVPVSVDVHRKTPVAVEAVTEYEFRLPKLRPKYTKVTYPVYLPRFIEVPVSQEVVEATMLAKTKAYESQLHEMRASASAMSLCEIENLAALIKRDDVVGHIARVDLQAVLMSAWQSGAMMKSSGHHYSPGDEYHASSNQMIPYSGVHHATSYAGATSGEGHQGSSFGAADCPAASNVVSASYPTGSSQHVVCSYPNGGVSSFGGAVGSSQVVSSYSTGGSAPMVSYPVGSGWQSSRAKSGSVSNTGGFDTSTTRTYGGEVLQSTNYSGGIINGPSTTFSSGSLTPRTSGLSYSHGAYKSSDVDAMMQSSSHTIQKSQRYGVPPSHTASHSGSVSHQITTNSYTSPDSIHH